MKSKNGLMNYRKAILPICNKFILFSLLIVLLLIVGPIVYVCINYFFKMPFVITFLFCLIALLTIISLCFVPFTGLRIKGNKKVVLITFYRISIYNLSDIDRVLISQIECINKRSFIYIKIVLKDKTIRCFDSFSQIKHNGRNFAKKLYSISNKEYQSFMNKTRDYDFIFFE